MSEINPDDLILRQIHIFHRHGDRSTAAPASKSKKQNELEVECWKQHLLDADTRNRLVKLFPNCGYKLPEVDESIVFGKLTKNGLNSLIDLGKELNKHYVETNFLHLPLQKQEVKCYCTYFRRTYESVQGLLYGLLSLDESIEDREKWFPKIKVQNPNPQPLNPVDSHFWKLYLKPELQEKIHEHSVKYDDIVPELDKYLITHRHYEFIIHHDYYFCNSLYNIPYPKELEQYKDIVLDECSHAFCLTYQDHDVAKYTSEYYLSKIYHQMLNMKHNFNNKLKCTISGAHDTSILSVLALFKPELCMIWPKYAAHIIFELYELPSQSKYFVRILYNFDVLKADNAESEYIPLEDFPKYFI